MSLPKFLRVLDIVRTHTEEEKVHPVLPNGLHTNISINNSKLFESPNYARMFLLEFSNKKVSDLSNTIDSLCGIQRGGSLLAQMLAISYACFHNKPVVHTNKDNNYVIEAQAYNKDLGKVLIVTDVINTASSIRKCINNNNLEFCSDILCVINNSGKDILTINNQSFKIRYIHKTNSKTWTAEKCPLCSAGSIPKDIKQILRQ